MGRLQYDHTADPILIEDETLGCLRVVIATKLRRHESFMMTWCPVDHGTDGRRSVWIHPAIPLLFGFDAATIPPVDSHRVAAMIQHLNATGELVLDHLIDPDIAAPDSAHDAVPVI